MNKKDSVKKPRDDSKNREKKVARGKEVTKKDNKGDTKSKPKLDSDKKISKDGGNKTTPLIKTSGKDKSRSPSKTDQGAKKSSSETKKAVKKVVNGESKTADKDKKVASKSRGEKDDKSKSSKQTKGDGARDKDKKSKADKSPSRKSSKSDVSKSKKSTKDDVKKPPEKKTKESDGDGDHKKKKDHTEKKERVKSAKPKAPTPEPTAKTPDIQYDVLNSAKNPDTHNKKLETAVKRKEYVKTSGPTAKQMWDEDEVRKAMDKENKEAESFNAEEFHKQKKTKEHASPTAHGKPRPTSKTVSFIPDEDSKEGSKGPKHVRSINFSGAKKEQQRKRSAQRRQSRGAALLSLIDLYDQEFDLFEMEPASYDQIMASFGKSGMQQGATQTNEDDLTEEIQTDEVKMRGKWTQHPIQFDVKVVTNKEGEVVSGPTYYDYMGVGGDMEEDEDNVDDRRQSSAIRLNKFLGAAGQCMLMLLEEELARTTKTDSKSTSGKLSFASSSSQLGEAVASLLSGRSVRHLSFCDTDHKLLVTAHSGKKGGGDKKEKDENEGEKSPKKDKTAEKEKPTAGDVLPVEDYGVLCVWSLNEPSQPQKVLVTSGQPTCCCFSPVRPRLVFAGCEDGSVDVWDLHESASDHTGMRQASVASVAFRSPTYSTAEIHRDGSHTESIVALRPVPVGADDSPDQGVEPGSFQICTLDRGGRLVFWVALSSPQLANLQVLDGDLGLAPWGRVKLVKISHVSVDNFLDQSQQTLTEVYDFRIHPTDPSHIYVSIGSGAIIHCTRQGTRATPKLFRPEIADLSVPVQSLAFCPLEYPYLLAGASDGSLRLHSTAAERPLITWNAGTDGAPIVSLAWSRCRPCVFFVVDADSKLNVWDLSAGDIFPAESDQVKSGHVTAMDVSHGIENDKSVTHVAVCTDEGTVEVHKVADKYSNKSEQESEAEMEQFLHYVQIV